MRAKVSRVSFEKNYFLKKVEIEIWDRMILMANPLILMKPRSSWLSSLTSIDSTLGIVQKVEEMKIVLCLGYKKKKTNLKAVINEQLLIKFKLMHIFKERVARYTFF